MTAPDTDETFAHDVRRSVVLAAYIRCWGMPLHRVVARHQETGHVIEVYEFLGTEEQPVTRFATVGVSSQLDTEFLLALPTDLGGATATEAVDFVFDVAAHIVTERADATVPFGIPETPLAPKAWGRRAVLVDEARGEPEELGAMSVGDQTVGLLWVVLLHPSEYRLIKTEGVAAFDGLIEQGDFSLVDLGRPPVA